MKKSKPFIICLIVLILSSLSFNNIFAKTYQEQHDELNNRQDNIQNQLNNNKNSINNIDRQYEDLEKEIRSLDSKISSQNTELEKINNKVKEVEELIKENNLKINKAASTQTGSEELLQARLRAIYENGISNEWEMMFTSNGFMDYLSKKRIISAITEYDRNLTDSMKIEKEYRNNLKKEIEAQKSQLDQLLYDREKTAKTLEMSKQNKENKSSVLVQSKRHIEMINRQLQAEEAKIRAELKKLEDENRNFVSEKGFMWPFPGSGRVTCHFGGYAGHTGMDISARVSNRTLVASKSGKVIKTVTGKGNTYPWSYDYGNCVYISHGKGEVTRYAHLSSVNVTVGQVVRQGQKIGVAGNTGYSTGPHLHFEVRINGIPKDPRYYVRYR